MSNEIPVVFHNGSNYVYHFIVKELENVFEWRIGMPWGKQKKCKNVSVSIKRGITKIDKDGNESVETIQYKNKFIDSMRSMATSLSKLVDNLTEGIHKIKCKDCGCFLEYENVKDNLIKYKCLSWNKYYLNKFDEELKKKFKNIFTFSKNDNSKFILLLKKRCLSLWIYGWLGKV